MISSSSEKENIRRTVWSLMEEKGISRFPKPVFGRIPNFIGAEKAALRLVNTGEYQRASVVKVNPDAPQRRIRLEVLLDRKMLLMPSPRLKSGFIVLDPRKIQHAAYAEASTIGGSFKHGRLSPLRELPKIDLVVTGSVAVSKDGVRLGKGGGYGEMEYAVLREIGAVREETPVFTTVHDIQIIDKIPREQHDLTVDAIMTPTQTLRIKRAHEQPKGILWDKITELYLEEIPLLSELNRISEDSPQKRRL